MLSTNRNCSKVRYKVMAFLLIGLLTGLRGYNQVGINGPTSVIMGNSYTYYPTINGSSSTMYSGPYTYFISGGVVTGTSNTSKSGVCSNVLYSIGVNITWTSSSGSVQVILNPGSSTLNITAVPALVPGTISPSSQTLNYGQTAATMSVSGTSGGAASPTYTYQWQSAPDAVTWTDIAGATSTNYNAGTLFATTYYRVFVTESSTFTSAYTPSVTVSVYPQVACTISPSSQTPAGGVAATPLTSTASGGTGVYIYQWQSCTDNINFTNISGATTPGYSPGVLGITTYFRLITTSNGATATSNTATVTVSAIPSGVLSITSTTPSGNGSVNILSCAASGGNGSFTYAWFSSINGGSSYQSLGITLATYTTPVITANTLYYVAVTSAGNTANSNVVSIIMPTAPTISANATVLCNGATSTLTATGGSGTYTWYNISNAQVGTGSTYATTAAGTFYAVSSSNFGISPGSNAISITVPGNPSAGSIQGATNCVLNSTTQLANSALGGTWSSSNAGIVKVNTNGIITGMAVGTATITYTLTNACGSSSQMLGITVVPFASYSLGLGNGIADPIITDTLSLVANTVKTTQYQQDTLYSSAHSIKNVLALRVVEETSKFIPGDFTATAVVKIEYGHSATDIFQVDSTKLVVNYTKAAGTKYNALNYFTFNNAEFTRITVVRVDAPTTVNAVAFDTKQVLALTNSLLATRYYKLADNKKPVLTYNTPPALPIPDALPVNWVYPARTNNNNTQLEWAWVENEMIDAYVNNNVFDTALLFKTGATRIDLPGGAGAGSYSIPLLYGGAGKLFVRVRGTNIMPTGSGSEGLWSGVQSFDFGGHSDSLNFQVTTSYAEEGKRKSVIQYFDGSLRGRQTVTKDNTTQTTVVAETIFDGQGRPAIQILPAPGINNIIANTKNLNKFNGQLDNTNPMDYFDFTTTPTNKYGTTPLSEASGTAKYYSNQNAELNATPYNKNIPAANGFAYSVTRYTPDATGRIMRQGGVGDSMQISGAHATKYFYGSPAPEELNALFGTEAGNYTHYFKNMVQDANGQMSVSYLDMHGRTVATALAGEAPTGMQALPISNTTIYNNQAGKLMTRNLLDKGSNVLKENSIESINTILVPFRTAYSFNYKLNKQILQLPLCPGGTVSYNCKFDLQISISDESGDTTPIVFNYPGIDTINFVNAVTLPAGSYSVRKTLSINQDSLTKFMQQYNVNNVGICRTQQFLTDSIATADSTLTKCGAATVTLTCKTCQDSLGTYAAYKLKYATSIGITDTTKLTVDQRADIRSQFLSDSSFCLSLNPALSRSLDNIRKQMLGDMVPYAGQYATQNASGTMGLKYNIFSTTGVAPLFTQPFYKTPLNELGAPDNYYDAFGRVDTTVTIAKLATLTGANFEQAFNNAWTSSLLRYHPEFNKFKYAQNNLVPSYNYIDSLNQTVSLAVNPLLTDPFFNVVSITADKDSITKYSNVSWKDNKSMWKLAYGDAFGCKLIVDSVNRRVCYDSMPKIFTATNAVVNLGAVNGGNITLTAAMQLQAWSMYKGFYTNVRAEMVNRYIGKNTDTTDNRNLITQGFRIYFPYDNVQQAQNSGFTSWYPNNLGIYPPVGLNDSVKVYGSSCEGYINNWKQALLQCPTIAAMTTTVQDQVLNSITGKMLTICKNGTDGANPYGSSTVSPANAGATYTSFEQAINFVMDSLAIPRSLLCNPYMVEYPKPYGKNPIITKQLIAAVDTCNCTQYNKLKTQITAAGYNVASLTSINQYLNLKYQDTISAALFQGLQKCGQRYYTYRKDSVSTFRTVNLSTGFNTITPDSVFMCAQAVVTFNSVVNTKTTCTYSYQWQVSTNGTSWVNIPVTTSSFTTTANPLNTNTYVRVVITCPEASTVVNSNAAYVTILPNCFTYATGYEPIYQLPLSSPQALPQFLTCGFDSLSIKCYSCTDFVNLEAAYFGIFAKHPVFTGTINSDSTIFYNNLFAKYVNFKTGLQKNWPYYAAQFTTSGCPIGGITGTGTSLSICPDTKALNDTTGLVLPPSPCQQVRNRAGIKAALLYDITQQQIIANFKASYLAKCLAATELFKVTDSIKEYHYTLYYYDQASNLIKTVPPKGVVPIYRQTWIDSVETAKTNGTTLIPTHTLVTRYSYNALNQVNIQKTPDGGVSSFWYDRLGRLAISQNARQKTLGNIYSYTQYDSLGRITQVGEITGGSAMTDIIARNDASIKSWISTATNTRTQITQTVYDTAYGPVNGVFLSQQNLRNRVSYSQLINKAADVYPASATYYSYDIHGNVDTLLQDYGNSTGVTNFMNTTTNRFKRMVYNFDLISGKVNQVSYQPGSTDAYYHKYAYDGENRITDVYTGRDSVMLLLFPEREAHYTYYKHGPLARTDLGQLRVQGMDYAYTLQGWLKGINPAMGGTLANGTDTTEAFPTAQDAYGFSLHYYKNDYKAIGYTPQATNVLTALTTNAAPLFNGNIAAMAVNIPKLGGGVKVYNYHYDQLNRLLNMDVFNGLSPTAGTFVPVSTTDYKEQISYDANGNILTYLRNGDAARTAMDNMAYTYKANKNQLDKVVDAAADATAANYPNYNDIKTGQANNNYVYDAIGNLIADSSENIRLTAGGIKWNVYGKITEINKVDSTTATPNNRSRIKRISYTYDAAGNRIGKRVTKYATAIVDNTWYTRDASGNVMSVYNYTGDSTVAIPIALYGYLQSETHLYGSSRLGIASQHAVTDSVTTLILLGGFDPGKKTIFTRGEKNMEMANHLGNVLVTVSDKKLQHTTDNIVVDYYLPDVVTANDYYPGGMQMPGRKYQATNSVKARYGFNGKENDNEVKGEGNQQDYGMRIYDPRLVRFLSVDPITKQYPELTPYQFASNRPIDGIDRDGLEYARFDIYLDKNNNVTKIVVTKDYELKNNGSKGAGIEYSYHAADGMSVEYKFVKNLHGIYQGGDNPQLPKIGKNYEKRYDDYSLEPIDETDAAAKQHDKDYDNAAPGGLKGKMGVIDDRSTAANVKYIKTAKKIIDKQKKGEKDEVTGKPVTKETAEAANFGRKGFTAVEALKGKDDEGNKKKKEKSEFDSRHKD
jgi:RHS repeat-associated protein